MPRCTPPAQKIPPGCRQAQRAARLSNPEPQRVAKILGLSLGRAMHQRADAAGDATQSATRPQATIAILTDQKTLRPAEDARSNTGENSRAQRSQMPTVRSNTGEGPHAPKNCRGLRNISSNDASLHYVSTKSSRAAPAWSNVSPSSISSKRQQPESAPARSNISSQLEEMPARRTVSSQTRQLEETSARSTDPGPGQCQLEAPAARISISDVVSNVASQRQYQLDQRQLAATPAPTKGKGAKRSTPEPNAHTPESISGGSQGTRSQGATCPHPRDNLGGTTGQPTPPSQSRGDHRVHSRKEPDAHTPESTSGGQRANPRPRVNLGGITGYTLSTNNSGNIDRCNVSSKNISSRSISSDQHPSRSAPARIRNARSNISSQQPQLEAPTLRRFRNTSSITSTDLHRPKATSARSSTSPNRRQVEQHLHNASVTCNEFNSTRLRHTASATRSASGARCTHGNYYAPYGTTISKNSQTTS